MNINKKKLNMTFEEIKIEQAKVDAMDCKIYAEELFISEEDFKKDLKSFISSMKMTLKEITDQGEFWYLWL